RFPVLPLFLRSAETAGEMSDSAQHGPAAHLLQSFVFAGCGTVTLIFVAPPPRGSLLKWQKFIFENRRRRGRGLQNSRLQCTTPAFLFCRGT
ncbi:MAG: hypothetical protein ONB49_14735, partial [candidate division KSB1 bacterium]|nr:hypothetical protein [candidate division KSB1 bacterium]